VTSTAVGEAPEDRFRDANERIRDAAKWLIGASAAVGAILVAGSQLSNIGKLQPGLRLWVAIAGAVLGLWGVVAAIWTAVRLLLPVGVTIQDVQSRWERWRDGLGRFRAWRQRVEMPDVAFFKKNPVYLGGWEAPKLLEDAYRNAAIALKEARDAAAGPPSHQGFLRRRKTGSGENLEHLQDAQDRAARNLRLATEYARHYWFVGQFRRVLVRLLIYATMTAVGIGLFAWAANPPEPIVKLQGVSLKGAILRDADLSGADFTGADFTNADLTGASLSGAILTDTHWRNTTCPDGKNSDQVGGTCKGHL
jgi:Pentapeptide repeats (8 copies)